MFRTITIASLLTLSLCVPAAAGTVQLPRTGQTVCYDDQGGAASCGGTGQDGDLLAGVPSSNPRFTFSGDCVTDSLTGLVWAKGGNLAGGMKSWTGALDWVALLNGGSGLCGYHDWRLPNLNELESLVNAEEADNAAWLNNSGFLGVQSESYWSSSTDASSDLYAWVVYMWDGYVGYGAKSSIDGYVWPVRGGE